MNKTGKACLLFSGISFDKVEELFVTNILTCILNLLLGVVTFVANSTILLTIKKNRDLHTPSFVLLGSLAASDLLVGLVCQPLFVAFQIAELKKKINSILLVETAPEQNGLDYIWRFFVDNSRCFC